VALRIRDVINNQVLSKGGIKEVRLSDQRKTNNYEAWYLEGVSLKDRGSLGALSKFRAVYENYPKNYFAPLAMFAEAELWFSSGSSSAYFEAFDIYKKIIDSHPDVSYIGDVKERIREICEDIIPAILTDKCAALDQTKYYPEVKT
jgi:hypothetical protein